MRFLGSLPITVDSLLLALVDARRLHVVESFAIDVSLGHLAGHGPPEALAKLEVGKA